MWLIDNVLKVLKKTLKTMIKIQIDLLYAQNKLFNIQNELEINLNKCVLKSQTATKILIRIAKQFYMSNKNFL